MIKLEGFISDYEALYGRDESDKTPGARFRRLIHNAAKQTGERVIAIFDEYDSAILQHHPMACGQ